MKIRCLIFLTSLFLFLTGCFTQKSETVHTTGTIRGKLSGPNKGGATVVAEVVTSGQSASVRKALNPKRAIGQTYSALSEQDGSFTISGVPFGNYYLSAKKGSTVISQRMNVSVNGPYAASIEMEAAGTGVVKGTVNLSGLESNAGVIVYLKDTSYLAITDAAGNFNLSDVLAGNYTLEVFSDGFNSVSLGGVLVSNDSDTTIDELSLETAGTITGMIYKHGFPNSLPVPGATVELWIKDEFIDVTTTDSKGVFSFTGYDSNRYCIYSTCDGYSPSNYVFDFVHNASDKIWVTLEPYTSLVSLEISPLSMQVKTNDILDLNKFVVDSHRLNGNNNIIRAKFTWEVESGLGVVFHYSYLAPSEPSVDKLILKYSENGKTLTEEVEINVIDEKYTIYSKRNHIIKYQNGQIIDYYRSPEGAGQVVVSPDNSLLYAASEDQIVVFSTVLDQVIDVIDDINNCSKLEILPDGSFLYASNHQNNNNCIKVIDTSNGDFVDSIDVGYYPIYQLSSSPNGDRIYCLSDYCVLSVIDTSVNEVLYTLEVSTRTASYSFAVAPDGTSVYVSDQHFDEIVQIDTNARVISDSIDLPYDVSDLEITPDGKCLVGRTRNTLLIIDLSTSTVEEVIMNGRIDQFSITPDGKYIYASSDDFSQYGIKTSAGIVVHVFDSVWDINNSVILQNY